MRTYRPRHDYGFVKIAANRWEIYRTNRYGESPKIGEVLLDYQTNLYTAYRLDGSRLDHPSGGAKHFCRQADAGKELWNEIQNGRTDVAALPDLA